MTNSLRLSMLAALIVTAGCGSPTYFDMSGDWCANEPKAVGGISVAPSTLTLTPGASSQLNATVTTPDGKAAGVCVPLAQWTTSNPAVASVDGSGNRATVTAVAAGQAAITVSTGGKSMLIQVTVTNPAAVALKLTVDSLALLAGQTARVGAVVRDASGAEFTIPPPLWSLSDSSRARVSPNGTLTALDTGGLVLRATTRNIGVTLSAEVRVRITNAAPIVKVQELSAGRSHTCALVGGGAIPVGTAYCWGGGSNSGGALGNGSQSSSTTPTPVTGGLTFKALASGDQFTCALTTAGNPYCWGEVTSGRLDMAPQPFALVPTVVATSQSFTRIAAAAGIACALTNAGAAYCWGASATTLVRTPTPLFGGLQFVELTSSPNAICGKTASGVLYCWSWELSWHARAPSAFTSPMVPSQLAASYFHTCGLNAVGRAFCWGFLQDNHGLGVFTGTYTTAVAVPGALTFTSIATAWSFMCGIAGNNTVCFGPTGLSNAGSGGDSPPPAMPGLHRPPLERLTAGNGFMCGIDVRGGAWCWGEGQNGLLGAAESFFSVPEPIQLRFETP